MGARPSALGSRDEQTRSDPVGALPSGLAARRRARRGAVAGPGRRGVAGSTPHGRRRVRGRPDIVDGEAREGRRRLGAGPRDRCSRRLRSPVHRLEGGPDPDPQERGRCWPGHSSTSRAPCGTTASRGSSGSRSTPRSRPTASSTSTTRTTPGTRSFGSTGHRRLTRTSWRRARVGRSSGSTSRTPTTTAGCSRSAGTATCTSAWATAARAATPAIAPRTSTACWARCSGSTSTARRRRATTGTRRPTRTSANPVGTRSGSAACATRGASRSTARPATSGSATWGRTPTRRWIGRSAPGPDPAGASTGAGASWRAPTATCRRPDATGPARRCRWSSTATHRTAAARSRAVTSTAGQPSRPCAAGMSTATTAAARYGRWPRARAGPPRRSCCWARDPGG